LLSNPRDSTWGILAVYLAVASLVFFGGPLALIATAMCFKHGETSESVRFAFAAVALVVGPLPVGVLARLAQREMRENAKLLGRGRVLFAYACAALMAAPVVAGVVVSLVRR
jgi:fructose-specific phosphotransferase system IIC component